MSTDDPGWDAQTPFDDEAPAAPLPPPAGGSGSGVRRKPPGRTTLLAIGGGVLAVVIVVVVLALTHHSGKKHSTTSPKTNSSPATNAVGSLARYDAAADAVCSTYEPQLTAAQHADDESAFLTAFNSLGEALAAIPPPTQDVSEQQEWLHDLGLAYQSLSNGDSASFDSEGTAADTLAGKLGMKVCNAGH